MSTGGLARPRRQARRSRVRMRSWLHRDDYRQPAPVHLGEWIPFGVFEVRDGRVLALEKRLETPDYDSVDAFAVALANPPPTVARVR